MSLFTATLLPGILLLLLGGALLWKMEAAGKVAKKSLRSMPVTIVTMGVSSAWFLYGVTQLGEADFGNYKNLLFAFFLAIAVLSFFHVKDFLAVRGAAILMLMVAKPLLDAAFMQPQTSRLLMVSFVYVCIVIALYLGTVPYKLRDFFEWLFARQSRARALGSIFALYGLILCGTAFSY